VLDVEAVVLDGDLPRPVLESLAERLNRLTLAAAPDARQVAADLPRPDRPPGGRHRGSDPAVACKLQPGP
jgi:hypothetical protein